MAAIDFKTPDWYDEEDINIFREAVFGFTTGKWRLILKNFAKTKW